MSLLVFLLACGAGAGLSLTLKPNQPFGRLAGLAGLLVAFGAALLIGSDTSVTIGEVTLDGSDYSGLFLACIAGSGLLLGLVALLSDWPDEITPAALVSFAGLAIAITSTNSGVSFGAAAAAATAGALVIVRVAPLSLDLDGRLAEIRTIGLMAAGLLFAELAVMRPPWAAPGDGSVLAVAFLGLALALAIRGGAVPFHIPAAHLGQTATRFAPALLLVWIPAGVGLLAVSWSATTFRASNDGMNWAVSAVQVVAVATLVLGALAALVHDELDEVVAYSIVADAGFLLLALAARSDAAAEPARLWLLAFVAAKTSLVAWAAAVSRAFGTSSLPRLRGWLRRTPLLGLALVAIVIATLGWPGSAVYEARATLIRLALPGQVQFLFITSIILSIAYIGRIVALGVVSPTEDVIAARSELPRWPAGPAKPKAEKADAADAAATPATADKTDAADKADAAPPESASMAVVPAPVVAAAAPASDPAPVETAPASVTDATDPAPAETPRGLRVAWRLNRTLEVSLVVVAGTVIAAALALGGLGARGAAQAGIPLDAAAHATPTSPPTPTPAGPTPTPMPTLAPHASGGASGSAGPGSSTKASSSPSPIKTSGPAQGDTG